MQRPAKILVIRFSSIGDIVLTTPVLRALKTQLEGNTEVHYLTKESYKEVLDQNPNIDKIFTIKENIDEVKDILEQENYDYIVDLHKNIRSAGIKHHLKKITFSFDKLNFAKFLLVAFGIDRMPDVHIVDRYMDSIKGFGAKDDGKGLDFYLTESNRVNTADFGKSFDQGYIAWVIGAAHEGKKMPGEKINGILKKMQLPVVLIGGKQDRDMGEIIRKGNESLCFNACGEFSIRQSASIIEQSKFVISGDTGMMHIASALGKNIISLWGCTSPKFGMYPYRPGDKSVIIEPIGLKKRPCSKLGNSCKYGMDTRCISRIEDQVIIEKAEELFKQSL